MADLINRKLDEIMKEFQDESCRTYQRSFSYGVLEIKGKENTFTLEENIEMADDAVYDCRIRNIAKYPVIFSTLVE